MRLPYIPDPPSFADSTSQAIVERIRDRRIKGGYGGLVELDKTLLHSPPVASGWNSFLGAIRTQTTLASHVRELVICRVAALNEAAYEWIHHEPILRQGLYAAKDAFIEGATAEEIETAVEAISSIVRSKDGVKVDGIENLSVHFKRLAQAVLNFVDASTKDVKVSDKTWNELRSACKDGPEGDKEAVEITATCAAYNCVSRFLVALEVGEAAWSNASS